MYNQEENVTVLTQTFSNGTQEDTIIYSSLHSHQSVSTSIYDPKKSRIISKNSSCVFYAVKICRYCGEAIFPLLSVIVNNIDMEICNDCFLIEKALYQAKLSLELESYVLPEIFRIIFLYLNFDITN
jgi:hypothetical protein